MRKFNISGRIVPGKHYYVELKAQIEKLTSLIEDETYFVINRPRQFGKTTLLSFLATHLLESDRFLPVLVSFEGYEGDPDLSPAEFFNAFWKKVLRYLSSINVALSWKPEAPIEAVSTFQFQEDIMSLCRIASEKKVVLLVDEVDSIPESAVISFLRGLREMYLERDRLPTFHAVALAGVHDIKNLKARYRGETETIGSASPFNIAIDYEMPPFSLANVRQYYHQHSEATGQEFDDRVIERVHHVTNGHPWLVSVLAKTLVEKIVPDRQQKILPDHAEEAIQRLVNSRNMNFESLFKNAAKPELFPFILELLQGRKMRFNIHSDKIYLGVKYGIFAEANRQLILGNPIYAQVLYQHFEEDLQGSGIEDLLEKNNFEDKPGRLDFGTVLEKFQNFMKAKGASVGKHPTFKEATAQLLFLSYLDLLVNGKGWTFKEVQSGEGRIDVLCTYGRQKEIVELKLWYGARKYEHGLEQLATYLDSESLDHGFLLVFDRRETGKKSYSAAEHIVDGKKIQAWVV